MKKEIFFKDISNLGILSKEEIAILHKLWKNNKDIEARNKILESTLYYIIKLATIKLQKITKFYNEDRLMDYIQEVSLKAIEMINTFDSSKGTITTYFTKGINQRLEVVDKNYFRIMRLPTNVIREEEKSIRLGENSEIEEKLKEQPPSSEENSKKLELLFECLRKEEREMIEQKFLQGKSYREIAKQKPYSYEIVRVRIKEYLKRMKEYVKEKGIR